MILSDRTIREYVENGSLGISPLVSENIQPASLDCTLGRHFLRVVTDNTALIKMDTEIQYQEVETDRIIMPPHSFLLATTQEYVKLPNGLTAFVEGRSSIGRMGLFIQNAGWVDAGFEGRITLELYNANSLPIELSSGRRICQLVFCKMDREAENPYRGKYYKQAQSVGSRVFMDVDVSKTV